ncbi:MAG: YfiR family protein [Cytophagaceae bacterium]|jgi:hypothetical protein|nr:YfiR family protein [Cytophagaceae bacterium]
MIACFLLCGAGNAQLNYKLHSIFIYKFTQYIEWPDKTSGGDFVIGVLGNSPIQPELNALAAAKKVGTRPIVIKKIQAGDDVSACHILFVASDQNSSLSGISSKTSGKPLLIISEMVNGAKQGASINLIMVDEKMKFEMNKKILERQGLKVSTDLVKLAIQVE